MLYSGKDSRKEYGRNYGTFVYVGMKCSVANSISISTHAFVYVSMNNILMIKIVQFFSVRQNYVLMQLIVSLSTLYIL